MDLDLPPTLPASGIPWEKVLPPLIPRLQGTSGLYDWTPTELLIPVSEYTGSAQVTCDQTGFSVQVDVKHFNPAELVVKVVGDYVVVEGKHEQKKDGSGLVTRQFKRRYLIPSGVDTMALESAMSPEGKLIISAPLQQEDNSRLLNHS